MGRSCAPRLAAFGSVGFPNSSLAIQGLSGRRGAWSRGLKPNFFRRPLSQRWKRCATQYQRRRRWRAELTPKSKATDRSVRSTRVGMACGKQQIPRSSSPLRGCERTRNDKGFFLSSSLLRFFLSSFSFLHSYVSCCENLSRIIGGMTWTLVDAWGILEVLVGKFVDFGLLALTWG